MKITWLRNNEEVDEGIFLLGAETVGRCVPIQRMRASRADESRVSRRDWFDLDQQDVDQIRRTNANPKSYSFEARLDRDREREQNPELAELVEARRKQLTERGPLRDSFAEPVLFTVPEAADDYRLRI